MIAHSLNYYGYDKETYNECRELIDDTNKKHVVILNLWFFTVNLFCILFSLLGLFSVNQSGIELYIFFNIITIGSFVISKLIQRTDNIYILQFYIVWNVFVWMSYCIRISVDQPYMVAATFMVVLVVISYSFITTMIQMSILLGICVMGFMWSSFAVKPANIATQDLYNVIIFLSLSFVLHFAFQRTRMQQFVTFQKNVQIQRELEIKSSFDALTSLLNRGRFFSLAGNILGNPHEEYMAICLLDLDGFKQINDKLGHQMGDKAIQIAGTTIINALNIDMSEKWAFQQKVLSEKGSFPGRLGGDEFIVFIRGKANRDEVVSLIQGMLNDLNNVQMGELNGLHASFGVTEIKTDDDIDMAYKRADEALYEAKRAGKNQIRFNNKQEEGA
ncbi:MAG: GGDEF domain-containing protein [Butyrivibrio sp.]|nr:GGDEF domain-containing protein [Butyrivibrio sp.]